MSYKLTQTGQKVQELLNQMQNNGQSQVTDAVLYSEQALNEKEQAQARKNIGAAAENQIPTGAVLYSQQQNLTGDQQAQARTNIGVPNKVSELENDAHYITESQVPIALPQKTGAIQSGVLPTSGWSTFDKEWVQTTLPANRRWHDVAYGDGKFVAVASDSDKGAYSTDGISWTEMSMPAKLDWYSVTYGNGKFVAVADSSNKGAYSTNGISWTEFALPVSERWETVTYGNGTFVTVAHNSSVGAYSPDGITWTTTTLPANRYWYSVTYGNGKFVAVAENYNSSACDKGACSNDGINWVEVTLPARQRWRCVAYGSGKFVAMGLDSRYGAYSTDGINWRRMSLSASRSWLNITYGDGRFVSLASSSDKGAYSTDGINWVEFTLPSTEFWSGVTYGNDKFVAVASQTNKGASGPKVTYLITDTSITANSDVLMELTDDGGVKAYSMEAGKITVIRDTVPTQPIPYTYKVKQTNASGQVTLVNHYVPQKVSELENDAHYITESQVPIALPQKTGALQSGVLPTAATAWTGLYDWWYRNTMPAERNWNSVTYGDDKFVAVADNSDKGAYSTDGRNWVEFTLPTSNSWESIVYGNDKFVAVADNSDKGAYSTDGRNWVEFTLPASRNWQGITYGNDRFVVVALSSDKGAYSLDGVNWVDFIMPAKRSWKSVTYGNGKFVAVAYNSNKGAYSTDGITWTEMTLPASRDWQGVTYGNDRFVVVADTRYSEVAKGAYSMDGISWTEMTMPNNDWMSVTYGDGRFIAVAYNSDSVVVSSSDGTKWNEWTLPANGYWNSVTYGDGKFVAVARLSTDGAYLKRSACLYTITDPDITDNSDVLMEFTDERGVELWYMLPGKLCLMRDTVPTQPIYYTYKVKQTNADGQVTLVNHFVPSVPESPTSLPVTYKKASGELPITGWSTPDEGWKGNTLPASRNWSSVTYGNGKYVAVAGLGSSLTDKGVYSTDGISWTEMNLPASKYWYSVTYGNGKFVAVADESNKGAYSTDGITWTEFTLPANRRWNEVTYSNDKFVAVASGINKGAYSTDGITWMEMTLPASRDWYSVTYGNGKYVAVASSSANGAYSTDGINWEEMNMSAYNSNWRSVTYGNGKFVAVAWFDETGAYSTDGISWTEMSMPAKLDWYSVTYGDGKFVAVAGESSDKGAYSADGISWTEFTMPASRDWKSVTYGNGKFVAVASSSANGAYWELATGTHIYTIADTFITANTSVKMYLTDEGGVKAQSKAVGSIQVIRDTVPTTPIPYEYEVEQTSTPGGFDVINSYVPTVPTKTSELTNDSGFTDNIGTITQIKINGKVKNPQPSGLIDLGNITPEPTDWTTVPITTALENGKTYVVKLDTTPYPLTAIFTMSEALDAIDANVVGGTQQGTDGASTYELKSATITVKDGKLIGLKSTNLVSSANPGAANLAYSESTFADLGITQYHYIELLNSVGGGMSGKGVNYTAIKDTLAIDKWTTDEIHVEGEILPTAEIVLVTFDDTVQHTIDKTKENTLLIGHATADELKNIGYWAFDGQSLVVNIISSTDPDTNAPLQVLFSETTDTYFKYLYQERNTTLATLYVYKSNYDTYTAGDIVLVLSADTASGIDWLKCSTLMPNAELNGFPAVKLYGYEFPSDLTGTSITIDVLCTKTDSPDIRKTLLLPYVGSEEVATGAMLHMYSYEPATEEEAQAFPMSFMAYVFNSNAPELAPAGTIIVFGGDQSSGSDPKYVFSKLFSLTTTGMAPVTYTYLNENIKLESAIKVYLNDSENIQIIDRQEGYVQFKRAKVADIPFSMEILDTEEEGLLRLFNSYKEPIPTKLSQFQNDTEYLTNDDIHVTSPIMKGGSLDGKPDLWLMSTYNSSFAQYSSNIKTGTLKVDSWIEQSGEYIYTITDYSIFNSYTDALMTVNSPIILEASNLTDSKLEIKTKSKPTEPISYSYKLLATDKKGQFTIVNSYMPTKVSELENDSGYITQLVTETLQGTKRYKTFEDLTDCVLELGQYDAEGKYVYCV